MEVIEGVKIVLDSDDIKKIIDEWAEKKMQAMGFVVSAERVEGMYPDVEIWGKK